jgi:anti-anti-sigma regulatory factor
VETVARDAKQAGRKIYLCGMNTEVEDTLSALEADKHMDPSDHFKTREQAMEAALKYLGN